jgi:hypothetical protein
MHFRRSGVFTQSRKAAKRRLRKTEKLIQRVILESQCDWSFRFADSPPDRAWHEVELAQPGGRARRPGTFEPALKLIVIELERANDPPRENLGK